MKVLHSPIRIPIRIPMVVRWIGIIIATFLIASCAIPAGVTADKSSKLDYWQGRLALKIHTDPVETFSANFELTGNAKVGTLTFSTLLGLTAAQLEWGEQGAKLRARGEVRDFESLDSLTLHAVGSKLPIGSMFAWLQGNQSNKELPQGWEADLSQLAKGKVLARRNPPEIPVDLKIVLITEEP